MKKLINDQQRETNEAPMEDVEQCNAKLKIADISLLNAGDEPCDYASCSSATVSDHLLNPNYVLGYN